MSPLESINRSKVRFLQDENIKSMNMNKYVYINTSMSMGRDKNKNKNKDKKEEGKEGSLELLQWTPHSTQIQRSSQSSVYHRLEIIFNFLSTICQSIKQTISTYLIFL